MLLPLHLNLENGRIIGRTHYLKILSSRAAFIRGGGVLSGNTAGQNPTFYGKSSGRIIRVRGGGYKNE